MRAGTVEARAAKRARIVLLAADGESNREHRASWSICTTTRSGCGGPAMTSSALAGLEDEERPGRPVVYDHDDVLLLVKLVTEDPPDGATRWTMEALAEAMADHGVPISASQVLADLQGPRPQALAGRVVDDQPRSRLLGEGVRRVRAVPQPTAKRRGVVGGREVGHAGQVPDQSDQAGRCPARQHAGSSSTKRNGTAVLFAALDVHEGTVAGWVTDSTRSDNFVDVLGRPGRPDARPASTCTASPTTSRPTRPTRSRRSVGGQPSGPHPPHAHPRQLAQPGRAVLLHPRATAATPWRVRLRRRPGRAGHRLHQGLQPPGRTVPLDLRRPPPTGRVSHNDLRARPLGL